MPIHHRLSAASSALIALLLWLAAPLSAQAPLPQAFADSLLFSIFRTDDHLDIRYSRSRSAERPLCPGQGGQSARACEALLAVQAGGPTRVPARSVAPEARIPGAEQFVRLFRGRDTTGLIPYLDLRLGFPERLAGEMMQQGRRTLAELVTRFPAWGPGWYGLASAALDVGDRPDSSLVLLSRASLAGDVPELLTGFLSARARLRLGDPEGSKELFHLLSSPDADSIATWVQWLLCGSYEAVACWQPGDSLTPTQMELIADRLAQPPWAYPIMMRSTLYPVTSDGRSRLLIPISLLRQNLAFRKVTTPSGERFIYPIRLHILAIRADGLRLVQDTLRLLATATAPTQPRSDDRERVELLAELPIPPGSYEVGVAVFDDNGGGAFQRHELTMAPNQDRVRVATFVAGRPGQGMSGSASDGPVWLAPGGEWQTSDSVALFAQVSGLTPGVEYRVSLELLPVDQDSVFTGRRLNQATGRLEWVVAPPHPISRGGVSISSALIADAGLINWRRTLLPGSFSSGAWCLRLLVFQGDSLLAQRSEPMLVGLNYRSWPDFLEVNFLKAMPQPCEGVRLMRRWGAGEAAGLWTQWY